MTETVTIPAHIENGSLHLDAPLPQDVLKVEVRVEIAPSKNRRRSVAEYLESLPPGHLSGEEIDRQLREERDSWPD